MLIFTSKLKGSGVYVWRTRKPASILGLPFYACVAAGTMTAVGFYAFTSVPWFLGFLWLLASGRHTAYVGETTSISHRSRQHLGVCLPHDEYPSTGQPWADLGPKLVLFIKLPRWKWLLRSVETLFILLLWPVYNHSKNKWNPRRIPLTTAKRMREKRNGRKFRRTFNIRPIHIVLFVGFAILAGWGTM